MTTGVQSGPSCWPLPPASGFRTQSSLRSRSVADVRLLRHVRPMTKPAIGDVFIVPLDGERYGIGQIAGDWKGELYIVVYDKVVSREASPTEVDDAELQFAALTLDA